MTLFGPEIPNSNCRFSSPSWVNPPPCQVKEETKTYIKMLDSKYKLIMDHEVCMRKYVLIRNNLLRLQKKFREEKLATQRSIAVEETLFLNLGNESPLPEAHFSLLHSPVTSENDIYESPAKRVKLYHDFDKENEMECDPSKPDASMKVPDDASILRDLCETYSSDGNRQSPNVLNDSPYSLSYSMSNVNTNSTETEWNRSRQVKCGSPFIINDYRGISSRSLLMPIES